MQPENSTTSAATLPADPSLPPYRLACDTYVQSPTGAWVPLARRVITSGATSG